MAPTPPEKPPKNRDNNKKIKGSEVDTMWPIGTPEELNTFLTHYKK